MAAESDQRSARPPLERMMRIHQEIAHGGFPNCRSMAERLEVSAKSIQRDLTFMRDRLGLPLEYDATKYGYYYTEPSVNFPTLQVSEGELFSMLVAEKAIHEYRGTSFEKPLISAFRKIVDSLPDTVSVHLSDWEQAVSFKRSGRPKVDLEIFDQLSEATTGRQRIAIDYKKPGDGAPGAREIDPYHLANVDGDWYLFAYCHLREDIRTFNPVRILEVRPTGQTFKAPTDIDIQQRLQDSFGIVSGANAYNIRLRFDAAVADIVREREWHEAQQLTDLDHGRVELRLQLSSLTEIHRWLLSWGPNVAVLEPRELREMVMESARAITKLYDK